LTPFKSTTLTGVEDIRNYSLDKDKFISFY